jgi:hypothetical protein
VIVVDEVEVADEVIGMELSVANSMTVVALQEVAEVAVAEVLRN